MYLNTLDVKLTPRTDVSSYNLEINNLTLEILSLILEFKLASNCHLSRFIVQKEQSKYLYRKLRQMWQAGLLESFKIFSGSVAGSTLYYMLSKEGIRLLIEKGRCERSHLKSYPKPKTLLSWGLFKHEAQIVELASLESLNKTLSLDISFKGEANSQSIDFKNDKSIEALTPDYTVVYKSGATEQNIYTEFERTRKSKVILLDKIQRYLNFISFENYQNHIVRLVFQLPSMEQAFWMNIFMNRPALLRLNIVTTNLELISGHEQFLQPVYASESTVKLQKDGRLKIDISHRIKLLNL